MKKLLYILLLYLPLRGMATNYTWDNTNGNITISHANYPLLKAGDTVFIVTTIAGPTVGYRSLTLDRISSGSPGYWITIYFVTGGFINPTGSTGIVNLIDSCSDVHLVNEPMVDNANAVLQLGTHGHNHRIWIDHGNYVGSNGMGLNYTGTLSSFTADTINCEYKWRISYCNFDSAIGGHDGANAITMGRLSRDGVWLSPEIDHDTFAHYSSATVASNFITASFCFGLKIDHNLYYQLGMNVLHPTGHAAQNILNSCQFDIFDNFFGPDNFGNECRIFGCVDVPSMPLYTGLSAFHNNIIYSKRKYPVVEFRSNPGDTTTLSPYIRKRHMPHVNNNTLHHLAIGAGGNGPYNASQVDMYDNDTLEGHNNTMIGPLRDSTCLISSSFMGVGYSNALFTLANGPVAFFDTANNVDPCTWPAAGEQDSATYRPVFQGPLYNRGVPVPQRFDYYGNVIPSPARPSFGLNNGVDIGAVQLQVIVQAIQSILGGRLKPH